MEWKFKKAEYDCTLAIDDDLNIRVKIGEREPFYAERLKDGAVIFYRSQTITANGNEKKIGGFKLPQYDEIKSYYENLKKEKEEKERREYEAEYNALMNGEKPLEISLFEGEYWQGYTATGVSRDVINDLHCGHDVDIYFRVDKEFIDGDIEKMKAHAKEIEEAEKLRKEKELEEVEKRRKEKEEMLQGVSWKVEPYGKKSYKHTIVINDEEFVFNERYIEDFGLVINPMYKVIEGESGGLASNEDGKLCWLVFRDKGGWQVAREMTENECRAYKIVQKYGKL